MRFSGYSRQVWMAVACTLVVAAGCGTANYEARLADTLNKLRGQAPFKEFFGPTQLADTPLKIRLPMVFKASYEPTSAHPDDGPRISPDRVQPPFLKLPGFKLCYENTVGAPAGTLPYYCYLAAVPAKPGDADRWAKEFHAALKEKFKETPEDWENTDCTGPDGKSLQWKKIHVEGEQPFRFKDSMQKLTSGNLPGIFELWLYDAQQFVVLVAWRAADGTHGAAPPPAPQTTNSGAPRAAAPQTENVKLDIARLAPLVAGSLVIDSEAPAAE